MMKENSSGKLNKLGIYVHIPFCISRCRYCGFYSNAVGNDALASKRIFDAYTEKLIKEITDYGEKYGKASAASRIIDTVFIGGGTPSIIPVEELSNILHALRENFEIMPDAEISMESNPKTLTEEKLAAYLEMGINRISIGVQSFDDKVLKMIGRAHNSDEAIKSIRLAKQAGFNNINIDLMLGIPGQSMESWASSLDTALAEKPQHISFYSLQIEEGTPFYKDYKDGKIDEVDTELDRKMYHRGISTLKAAGFSHYEISNAALPGFECKHNLKYWNFEDYLGIGDSASSFVDGVRFNGEDVHINSDFDSYAEFVFTGLRKTAGISKSEFKKKFDCEFWDVYSEVKDELELYFGEGLIIEDGDIIRLSERGIDCSNEIMACFV